jgi:hypothetical protein
VIAGIAFSGPIDPVIGFPEFDAVVWKDGQIIDLGTFGGTFSYANAINDQDQAVGFGLNLTPDSFDLGDLCENFPMPTQMRAFVWQNGVKQDLGTLGGTDSCALFELLVTDFEGVDTYQIPWGSISLAQVIGGFQPRRGSPGMVVNKNIAGLAILSVVCIVAGTLIALLLRDSHYQRAYNDIARGTPNSEVVQKFGRPEDVRPCTLKSWDGEV